MAPTVIAIVPQRGPAITTVSTVRATSAASAEQLYEIAPPPKAAPEIVPADDHGTDLLTGSRGEAVQRIIETYLAQFSPP